MAITAEACRAARAILKWSTRDLARESGVRPMTVNRLEAGAQARTATAAKVAAAFAAHGVELVIEDERTGAVIVRTSAGPH